MFPQFHICLDAAGQPVLVSLAIGGDFMVCHSLEVEGVLNGGFFFLATVQMFFARPYVFRPTRQETPLAKRTT
jgi:hypothetical protein